MAFLSQRSAPVSVLGLEIDGAGGPADRHGLRDLALLPVRLPVPHRPHIGAAGRPGGGGGGGRGHGQPAVPLRRVPAARCRPSPCWPCCGSSSPSTSSTTSTCSPAARPAPRWPACGCTTCSPPAATSARRRRRRWCSRCVLVVLLAVYFRFVGRPTGSDVTRTAPAGGRHRPRPSRPPRPRREPRVRRAAVGGDRRPRAGDPAAVLLHDHPVGAAPGRGRAAPRAAVAGVVRPVDLRLRARLPGGGWTGLRGVPAQQRGHRRC